MKYLIMILLSFVIASCGGGGGGSAPVACVGLDITGPYHVTFSDCTAGVPRSMFITQTNGSFAVGSDDQYFSLNGTIDADCNIDGFGNMLYAEGTHYDHTNITCSGTYNNIESSFDVSCSNEYGSCTYQTAKVGCVVDANCNFAQLCQAFACVDVVAGEVSAGIFTDMSQSYDYRCTYNISVMCSSQPPESNYNFLGPLFNLYVSDSYYGSDGVLVVGPNAQWNAYADTTKTALVGSGPYVSGAAIDFYSLDQLSICQVTSSLDTTTVTFNGLCWTQGAQYSCGICYEAPVQ